MGWWRGGSWRPSGALSPTVTCRFWPCLISLVLAVLLLQVLHLALLARLEARRMPGSDSDLTPGGVGFGSLISRRQLQGRNPQSVLVEWEEKIRTAHRLDKSGTYHLLDNFLPSELALRGRAPYDVSLVTQCSSSRLEHLVEQAQLWDGPASVAVFTHDADFDLTARRLLHLHFCIEHVFRHVSFHLVYPISRAPKPEHVSALADFKIDCSSDADFERYTLKHVNYEGTDKDLAFPNNLLRNLAVNYAQTPYVLVIDVDMVPSRGLRAQFQRFMASRTGGSPSSPSTKDSDPSANHSSSADKTLRTFSAQLQKLDQLSAFVIPVFEAAELVDVPRTKSELIANWETDKIRPFYWEVCRKCQEATSYERWRGLPRERDAGGRTGSEGEGEPLHVGYTINHVDPWEPFYIARTSLPLYDERFKQYGFNRISQICEMHVAGFSFHVLDNAFLLHRGLHHRDTFHSSKDAENDRNRLLFRKFKDELKVKYPDSQRHC